jgi:hypothetical protein
MVGADHKTKVLISNYCQVFRSAAPYFHYGIDHILFNSVQGCLAESNVQQAETRIDCRFAKDT